MTYEHDLKLLANKHVDHYAVRKFQNDKGFFWRLQAVFGNRRTEIGRCYNIATADTFEEIQLWCDLHNVKVKTVHR